MDARNNRPLDPDEIAAAWSARAAAAGFGPAAAAALRTAPPTPELYPRCAVPAEYLVLAGGNEATAPHTITVATSWCLIARPGTAGTVIATKPALAAGIRAGEMARVARGINLGVRVCSCAEPKRTTGPGHSYPELGCWLPGQSLSTRYVRWVRDDRRLAEAVRDASPAVPVVTTAGPISPDGELLEPSVYSDRADHYWVMEGGVPVWQ